MLALLAMAALVAAEPPALADEAPSAIKMDPATQARLGIATASLVAARHSPALTGYTRAVDATPLATLDSDIVAAASTLQASRAEAQRTRTLAAADQTVSRKVAEQAAAQARADAAKLALLRRRLGLEWGPAIAALSDARRARLIADIATGRANLVRIDAAGGLAPTRGTAVIELGPAGRARATILGPSRTGEPRLQSTGLLALVRGPNAMALGLGVVAPATLATGPGVTGVVAPRSALMRSAGETFVYIRKDASTFEERPIEGIEPDPRGLFVREGLKPGERVVVQGAAKLFTAAHPAAGAD
jgi:multidrug efflux pump subunit AcrA (membrane-fusion protein)